jgi:hypothetical protein
MVIGVRTPRRKHTRSPGHAYRLTAGTIAGGATLPFRKRRRTTGMGREPTTNITARVDNVSLVAPRSEFARQSRNLITSLAR